MRIVRLPIAAVLAPLVASAALAVEGPVSAPPLVTAEGKVLGPPAAATAVSVPAPAVAPAPAATGTEPVAVKVSGPVEAEPVARPAVKSAPRNALSIDLVRLLSQAVGLAYERRLFDSLGVALGVRVPWRFTLQPTTVAGGPTFTDTTYPWLLLNVRYQVVGTPFKGPFLAGAVGGSIVQSQWTAAPRPEVVLPDRTKYACTPGQTAGPYCMTAPTFVASVSGGYSYALFDHLLLEGSLGIQFGVGAEILWKDAGGRLNRHLFAPPLSLIAALSVGYAF